MLPRAGAAESKLAYGPAGRRPRGCQKMSGNVTQLRPKQEQAILALLTNPSVEHAARAVKITPRTLYRWLNEPAFEKAYRQARRTAFGQGAAVAAGV